MLTQPCLSVKYIVPRVGVRVAATGAPTPKRFTRAVGEIYAERENVLDGATNKVWLHVNIFYWPHSSPMVPVDYP